MVEMFLDCEFESVTLETCWFPSAVFAGAETIASVGGSASLVEERKVSDEYMVDVDGAKCCAYSLINPEFGSM